MRRVESADVLLQAIQSTQTLAGRAFGDEAVYLERCIDSARHVEVQVFGFGNGEAVHLFERDCSMQRRYQKVIEEAPAFAISPDLVKNLCDWSVQLAASQHYSGAGTVEFIVDSSTQTGYFLEMNTRIQVEHPVTELISGKDLVQLQLKHAAGHSIESELAAIKLRGHAIECRIYAEKPHKNFMPSPGVLSRFEFPDPKGVLRLDTGVRAGDAITPYYDPMLAKCIVHAASRDQAINDMVEILELAQVEGVETNIRFLIAALSSEEFRQGGHDTKFIEQSVKRLLQ
jgi:3-methylcrotonyl-CoA carboxylase alpha subunit